MVNVDCGGETLVSDGLNMLNLHISSSAFEMRRIDMPPDTYLGNQVHYPPDSRVGDNCLIATKAAVPIDGPVRTNVGILGSPPFEIPRSVARDHRFDHFKQPGVIEDRLRLKLHSNLLTLAMYLVRLWAMILMTLLGATAAVSIFGPTKSSIVAAALAIAAATVWTVGSGVFFAIFCERAVRRFKPLEPLYCSLYDKRFWVHERFWKMNNNVFLPLFDGTPMRSSLDRLRGATIGKHSFHDGSGMPEPTLIEIGDNATLNFQSVIQCHSLEDGTFKSDRVVVGDDCVFGVAAFIHYGTTIGDGAIIDTDSFLMKGSTVPNASIWHGNPARNVEDGEAIIDLTDPITRTTTPTAPTITEGVMP